MRSRRVSARWGYGLVTGLSLVVACGESSSPPSDEAPASDEPGATVPGNDERPGSSPPASASGSPDAAHDADAADAAGSDGAKPPPAQDQGQGDGHDVVSLGDSYMRLPNLVQAPGTEGVDLSLAKVSGQPYRTFAFTGGSVFPPIAVAIKNGVIPGQFTNAKNANADIKTVVMSGGANDIDDSDGCKGARTLAELSAQCKTELDSIDAAVDKLVADMAKAGVKDVVWVGYGPTPTTGNAIVEGAIAYLRAARKAKCVANNPALGLRCHYVDNFAASVPTRDGFHPTGPGYDLVGKAVWDRMKAEGTRR